MAENLSSLKGYRIDLNADLGEGSDNDDAILALVSSANIACGGHTGDTQSMQRALECAKQYEVAIGAHPSFPDRENFGRKAMQLDSEILFSHLLEQVQSLATLADALDLPLTHIKPHGALYNQAAHDPMLADVIIRLVQSLGLNCRLFALAASPLVQRARQAGITVIEEAFADRRYQNDASLVPRHMEHAVIESVTIATDQSIDLIKNQRLTTISGQSIALNARTLCVHGDGEHALQLIQHLRQEFARQQIQVASYLSP